MPHTPLRCADPESLPSALVSLLGFPPHDGQLEAIRRLAIDQQDLILIAPTGWGKSAVFQAIPALRGGVCLMIMPLNLLEQDQANSISRIPNCKPCVLNRESINDKLLNEIRIGTYTHVLLGPEIALSERFRTEVLYDQSFQDHLVLVAIDEFHVVAEWGRHWRTAYSQLALLRDAVSRSVPWLGCSATLDPVTLAEVRDLSGFGPSVHIQRVPIDRPDITFVIQAIQYQMNSFRDLEFLTKPVQGAVDRAAMERRENMAREAFKSGGGIDAAQAVLASTRNQQMEAGSDSRAHCKAILKTIVYVDSIALIIEVVNMLRRLLARAGCSEAAAADAVQPYHSGLADYDKKCISAEFEKPDTEGVLDSSVHRIIVATDAMGMGIDNPDIRLVIQWGLPPSMGALLQRAGRAARGKGIRGKFVWLVPAWCFGERIEQSPLPTAKRLTDRERRSLLPRGMYELVNGSACVRRGILEFFGESCTHPVEATSCCSKCMGDEVRVPTSKAGWPVKSVQSPKHITDEVKQALIKWREAKAVEVFSQTSLTTTPAELVIPDKAVTMISRTATTVISLSSLAEALDGEWGDLATYGREVLEVTQEVCLQAKLRKLKIGR